MRFENAGKACGASVALPTYPFWTQFSLWPLEAAAGGQTARPSGRRTIERHVDVQPVGSPYRRIRQGKNGMPTLLQTEGFRFFFYSNERLEPPHVE